MHQVTTALEREYAFLIRRAEKEGDLKLAEELRVYEKKALERLYGLRNSDTDQSA